MLEEACEFGQGGDERPEVRSVWELEVCGHNVINPQRSYTFWTHFASVCLNAWVFQTVYLSYRYRYGNAEKRDIYERVTHRLQYSFSVFNKMSFCRQYQFIAYRQLVGWCRGWLGRRVKIALPNCAVNSL